jgi:4-amino-4-deoxy-L-arabinose transferase-like glycosyltransferase
VRGLAVRARETLAETLSDASSREILVWLLFTFALLVRFAVVAETIGFDTPAYLEPSADSRIHIALVQNLLSGRGYSLDGAPTAITPPLYVLVIAGLYWLSGDPSVVRIVQAVLGALSCVVLYAIGQKLFDSRTGLVAGVLLALYPLPVYLSGLHLTENLFLILLLLVLWQALRMLEHPTTANAAGLGALIGLTALTRAVFVAFLPFVLLWVAVAWGIRARETWRVVGITVAATVMVVLPWSVRNYIVLRAIVPIQSNGGLVFWAGNNSSADGGLVWPTSRTWTDGQPPNDYGYGWRGLTLAATNRRYMAAAIAWIREHPSAYVRLLGHKLMRLYGFTRATDKRDVHVPLAPAVFQISLVAMACAGLYLSARRWRTLSLLLALIVFTNLMVLLFSGGTRYTIPMVPSIVLFSAVSLVTAGSRALRALGPDGTFVEDRA